MKLTDKLNRQIELEESFGRKGGRRQTEPVNTATSRRHGGEADTASPTTSDRTAPPQRRLSAVEENGIEDYSFGDPTPDDDLTRFHDRLMRGKIILCQSCGNVMTRSSRMVISPVAGVLLIILGATLMFLYGLATIFYDVPWFLKFLLPASYYVGSIFVGVGIVFFFIRERVWKCQKCMMICKR